MSLTIVYTRQTSVTAVYIELCIDHQLFIEQELSRHITEQI